VFVLPIIEDITAEPLPPQPMIPILMAEFAREPKAADGEISVIAEAAAVPFKNVLRLIFFISI